MSLSVRTRFVLRFSLTSWFRFVNLLISLISMFIFWNCFSNFSAFISSTFYYVLQEPEAMVVSLTKVKEQQILIALSKVLSLLKSPLLLASSCNSNFSLSTWFIFNSFRFQVSKEIQLWTRKLLRYSDNVPLSLSFIHTNGELNPTIYNRTLWTGQGGRIGL